MMFALYGEVSTVGINKDKKKNEKLDEMLSQFVDVQKRSRMPRLFLRHTSTGRKKRTLLGGHRGIHALPSGATRNCRMNVKRWNS